MLRHLVLLSLVGCTYINAKEYTERLDLDGDGIPADVDCDPDSAEVSVTINVYPDADGDGYGDASAEAEAFCALVPPEGYAIRPDDCDDSDASLFQENPFFRDQDGDGVGTGEPELYCGAPAGWVSVSGDDCDEEPGLLTGLIYYADADGDGRGAEGSQGESLCSIEPPAGFASRPDDCDDANALLADVSTFYLDGDGDGVGAGEAMSSCGAPEGWVALGGDDCDDEPDLIRRVLYYRDEDGDGAGARDGVGELLCQPGPGNGWATRPDDCNDLDPLLLTETNFYIDEDGDGFGTGEPELYCGAPDGWVSSQADACDANAEITVPVRYYPDEDGDGFGAGEGELLCEEEVPEGYSSASTDCNDENATITALASYVFDEDGDGRGAGQAVSMCVPEEGWVILTGDQCDTVAGLDNPRAYYPDGDSDGHGRALSEVVLLCAQDAPDGYAEAADDCDDDEAGIWEPEVYYRDDDGDGYGALESDEACSLTPPVGLALFPDDCDDDEPLYHDGNATYYSDADGDSHGNPVTQMTVCVPSADEVSNPTDCNDTDATVNPDAPEICDGQDNDCNLEVDDQLDFADFYVDDDGDTWPSDQVESLCDGDDALLAANPLTLFDCDDTDPLVFPENPNEVWYDGVDGDCAGDDDFDQDGDGYRSNDPSLGDNSGDDCDDVLADVYPGAYDEWYDGDLKDCDRVSDFDQDLDGEDRDLDGGSDCDDSDPLINTSAEEIFDDAGERDENCNGGLGVTCFQDADEDSFGTLASLVDDLEGCEKADLAVVPGDCDDSDAAINPGATEYCDGIDTNCDTLVDPAGSTAQDADGVVFFNGDGLVSIPTSASDTDEFAKVTVAVCDGAEFGLDVSLATHQVVAVEGIGGPTVLPTDEGLLSLSGDGTVSVVGLVVDGENTPTGSMVKSSDPAVVSLVEVDFHNIDAPSALEGEGLMALSDVFIEGSTFTSPVFVVDVPMDVSELELKGVNAPLVFDVRAGGELQASDVVVSSSSLGGLALVEGEASLDRFAISNVDFLSAVTESSGVLDTDDFEVDGVEVGGPLISITGGVANLRSVRAYELSTTAADHGLIQVDGGTATVVDPKVQGVFVDRGGVMFVGPGGTAIWLSTESRSAVDTTTLFGGSIYVASGGTAVVIGTTLTGGYADTDGGFAFVEAGGDLQVQGLDKGITLAEMGVGRGGPVAYVEGELRLAGLTLSEIEKAPAIQVAGSGIVTASESLDAAELSVPLASVEDQGVLNVVTVKGALLPVGKDALIIGLEASVSINQATFDSGAHVQTVLGGPCFYSGNVEPLECFDGTCLECKF